MSLERLKQHPARYAIPNGLTLARPVIGAMAVQDARRGNWKCARNKFVAAGATDFEGNVARCLDATSEFGAQADPVADFMLRVEGLVAFWPVMNKVLFGLAVLAEADNLRLNAKIQKGRRKHPAIPLGAKLGALVEAAGALAFTEGMDKDDRVLRLAGQLTIAAGAICRNLSYRAL